MTDHLHDALGLIILFLNSSSIIKEDTRNRQTIVCQRIAHQGTLQLEMLRIYRFIILTIDLFI